MIAILIVCEGNVCRSPYVERVLRARLDAVAPGAFQVSSAGTAAEPGAAMFPRSSDAVLRHGADPSGFAGTPLTARVLDGPALVLTLERQHRAAVLDIAPALLRRTFTLREFERLVRPLLGQDAVGAGFWDDFPRLVAGSRLGTAPTDPEADDITDPVRGDDADHARMCALADEAIDAVVACAARATEGARDARTARA